MTKVQRYKVGFFSDEWGMSGIQPRLIPDDSGYAVKFEDYCKLETEIATLKAENEWQPIETAPKDGAWIVVTSTHNKYYRACVQFYDGHWYDTQEVTHDDLMENAATHWMPLPKPPAMAQGENG